MNWKYLTVCILMFVGCSKPKTQYIYLTDYTKSMAAYQVGSYWVFKNDSTLDIDSIYVYRLEHSMYNSQKDGAIETSAETYYCRIGSSLFQNLKICYHINSDPQGGCYSFTNWDFCFLTNDSKISSDWPNRTLINLSTLSLNGLTYNNVTEIIDTVNKNSNYHPYTIDAFILPNIGLIKWNIQYKDSLKETWSLLRSHIVQ